MNRGEAGSSRIGFSSGFNSFQSSSNSVMWSIIAVLLYMFVGVVTFSLWFDKWSVIDSMYFTVVTFTTCGYGDISPLADGERIFVVFFILIGMVALGGIALGIIFDSLFSAYQNKISAAKKSRHDDLIDNIEDNLSEGSSSESTSHSGKSINAKTEIKNLFITFAPWFAILISMTVVMGHFEKWSFTTSFYYFIVTATSEKPLFYAYRSTIITPGFQVGYGDVAPQTQGMRLLAVVYLPVSVLFMAKVLGCVADSYMKKKAAQAEQEFMNRKMTVSDLKAMDYNKNGAVEYGEFLTFMLITMGKVDKGDLDQLRALFDKVDVNRDGDLNFEDLVELTKSQD